MERKAETGRMPPPASDASRRGVGETAMIGMLAHGGFSSHLAAGRQAEAHGLAAEALDRWVAGGLAHEIGADGKRRFDPAEVINGFKWAGLHGQDDFWRDCWIATGRQLVSDFAARDAGSVQARLARRFDLGGFADDADILLRAPTPLAGEDHALPALEPEALEGLDRAQVADGRITARLRRGPRTSATLGWTATLARVERPAASVLSPVEAELYLRPTEGFIRVGPRIQELAERWSPGRSGWEAVLAFRRELGRGFCLGVIGYEAFSAQDALDWVLQRRWFDCLLGSALLVSLCRAGGLPARLVHGHFLYSANPANHVWCEVFIPGRGWAPVDLIGWELSAGDTDADRQSDFLGWTDWRLVTERPPRRVTGPMSLRLPGAWRVLQNRAGEALDVSYVDAATGRALLVDRIQIEPDP